MIDDLEHYMTATSRLSAENSRLNEERKQISKALNLKGVMGEDIAPIAYVLAAIEALKVKND